MLSKQYKCNFDKHVLNLALAIIFKSSQTYKCIALMDYIYENNFTQTLSSYDKLPDFNSLL